jgi:hypothetical protein
MYFVNNSVVVVVVVVIVVAVIVKIRNYCYNGYLPLVMMYWFFFGFVDCEQELGRKCWMWIRSKLFLLEVS